ncbi:uncharacterized protein Z518_01524 [Rhinocladiella mackenziei CBS 650.93]|uniref:Rhinocladiella mackenziei CBS 650.93 unplaced genomic scaffold supercont1.1, whole genome shotgun sequence n=1 Tax=Rhinocladiella mackenziei CBS 650.93 TaxID=1442369 RepID=A0A0D2G672_9EURO|nr:uncharacterized protein Z518_01524 [Rhinocladiella mackenziei CBS 650.93]KIX10442.1 hypothetical protein Z518_01524 [Rhinocladiella mackenziei CBS 650.93]
MADNSSFMDWSPATPPPVHSPYQGDYMPGGWPVDSPTPPPTVGVFAIRTTPYGSILPAAKRICQGIGAAVTCGIHAAATVSKYTVDTTTTVVTVPTHYVARQVAQRQQEPRRLCRTRRHAQLRSLPESPWNRAIARADHRVREPAPPAQEGPSPSPSQVTPSLLPPTLHPSARNAIYHIPNFLPLAYKNPAQQRKERIAQKQGERIPASAFPGIPRLTPPPEQPIQRIQTPVDRPYAPLPQPKRLQTPYPVLTPLPVTPPSPPTSATTPLSVPSSRSSPSPGAQLQRELEAAHDSDSDTSSTYSTTWNPKKRKLRKQGSRASEETEKPATTKRVHTTGPKLHSPKTSTPTPTPAIVIQETASSPTGIEAPASANTTLLSPPRVKRRRVSTPTTVETKNSLKTPKTPESDISSTCEYSPGISMPGNIQAKSPNESDISSAYFGTPPDPVEDARLFGMIMAGSGSPTPGPKASTTSEELQATQKNTATSESKENETHDHKETKTAEAIPEIPQAVSTFVRGNIQPESADRRIVATKDVQEGSAQQSPNAPAAEPATPEKEESSTAQTAPYTKSTGVAGQNDDIKLDKADVNTPEQKLAKLTLEDQTTPDQPTPKATPHSSEKTQRLTRAVAKRLRQIEEVQDYDIAPLSEEWEKKVQTALRQGHGDYKASDLIRVVPLTQGYGTSNWLNDEVINGYLKLIVAHGKRSDRPTQVPTHHAFVSFFYDNLATRGYGSVKRWATRAKIGGKNLLETENVFIPINSGAHWTLCVVSGKNRIIAYYDSMGGNGKNYVDTVKKWVKEELGSAYKEEEWKLEYKGRTPLQQNMDDCGVFAVTSARQIMLGLTPMSYEASKIPLQRRRIIAELINGALIKSNE